MMKRMLQWLHNRRAPKQERAVLAETDRILRDVPPLLELYHRQLEAITGMRIPRGAGVGIPRHAIQVRGKGVSEK